MRPIREMPMKPRTLILSGPSKFDGTGVGVAGFRVVDCAVLPTRSLFLVNPDMNTNPMIGLSSFGRIRIVDVRLFLSFCGTAVLATR